MATLPPANYQPHTLVTFGGSMGTGADAEIWQCGVRMLALSGTGAGPIPNLDGYHADMIPALKTWFADATVVANWAKLNWVKAANIGADGHYLPASSNTGSSHQNPFVTNFASVSGATASSMPWVLTCVLSFHTNVQRGPSSHGRIYLPLSVAVGTSGNPRLTAPIINAVGTKGTALLTLLAKPDTAGSTNNPGFNIQPHVVSRKGPYAKITQVRVGDVVDIQRRRKSALRENYVTTAWS